jgi:periplasmic copper chaperone A
MNVAMRQSAARPVLPFQAFVSAMRPTHTLLAATLALVLAGCQAEAPAADAAAPAAAPETAAAPEAAAAEDAAPAANAHVGLMAHEPWSRPLAPGATVAAGYMHLMNHTTQPETLVGARAEGVGRVELHDMAEVDGVMQMRPIDGGVPLVVDGMAAFQPGGKHLMFMDVTRSWNDGDVVPVTLVFESGTEAVIDFAITASKGEAAGDEHAHH